MRQVRGRFAPSPSGELHLGNVWTALLAWLQIKKLNGRMVLRMEDLDPQRSRPTFANQLMEDLRWLGLTWDEGADIGGPYCPYNQDDRRELYQAALGKLAGMGLVYPCFCSRAELQAVASAPHASDGLPVYQGSCRGLSDARRQKLSKSRHPSLRLIVPAETISFNDLVWGPVVQNMREECGDFIICRSDGVHAYQLAVVVDDAAMKISHVLRGDDLLGSTARQILLYRLLGQPQPQFAHVPLLYGLDGHRLSKRHQSTNIRYLRARGVTAEGIIGFLAFKAHLIDDLRPVSAEELVAGFDLARLPAGPVEIDAEQLVKP